MILIISIAKQMLANKIMKFKKKTHYNSFKDWHNLISDGLIIILEITALNRNTEQDLHIDYYTLSSRMLFLVI